MLSSPMGCGPERHPPEGSIVEGETGPGLPAGHPGMLLVMPEGGIEGHDFHPGEHGGQPLRVSDRSPPEKEGRGCPGHAQESGEPKRPFRIIRRAAGRSGPTGCPRARPVPEVRKAGQHRIEAATVGTSEVTLQHPPFNQATSQKDQAVTGAAARAGESIGDEKMHERVNRAGQLPGAERVGIPPPAAGSPYWAHWVGDSQTRA